MSLFQLGAIQFEVAPVNVAEVNTQLGADYAAKDLVGAHRTREYMGPADQKIVLKGTLFPHRLGGLGGIAVMEAMAVMGIPQMLVRGDGLVFGWFVIETVTQDQTFLNGAGVGRMIEFQVTLIRSPTGPSIAGIASAVAGLIG